MPRSLPALVVALATLALPGAAHASQLATKPVPVGGGYALSVIGGDGGPAQVRLLKRVPGGDQDILITHRATYAAKPDLSQASLKANLGALGTVSLTFRAKGAIHGLPVPEGCSGKRGRGRDGVVTGRITLTLGTTPVRAVRAPAVLAHRGGDILCLDPLHYPSTSRNRLTMQIDPETAFRVDETPAGAVAAATLTRSYPGHTELLSVVTQQGPASAFGVSGKLAGVSGDALGPFFAGRLEFLQGLGIGLVRASDFRILFDFFGAKTAPAGIDGILRAGG